MPKVTEKKKKTVPKKPAVKRKIVRSAKVEPAKKKKVVKRVEDEIDLTLPSDGSEDEGPNEYDFNDGFLVQDDQCF